MNFIRSGFRTVRENPALIFAEIAWRWAFGAAAWVLVVLTVRAILQGIDVSSVETTLAKTDNAYLIADVVVRILVQVLPRLAQAMLVVVPALSICWIAAATLGRAATLRVLLGELQGQANVILGERPRPNPTAPALSLVAANVLRALFTIATFLAFFGTVFFVSSRFTPETAPEVVPAYVLVWLLLAFLVGLFWTLVNWFLALAPIFIVRDRLGPGKAMAASLDLYRHRRRDYLSISTWFGFFRGAALLVALVAASVVVAAGTVRLALAGSGVVALAYFAVADCLYIARLAAFVGLAEAGSAQPAAADLPPGVSSPSPAAGEQDLKLESETRN